MAITIADNFKYQGKKPLDERLLYNTLNDMITTKSGALYDGMIVFNKETQKFYTYNSANKQDPILRKWREFTLDNGQGSKVKEYKPGEEFKKDDIIVKDGILYIVDKDFTASTTGGTDKENLDIDVQNKNIHSVDTDTDTDTHSFEYTVGTDYKVNNLVTKNNKLYIVTKDFTATDFDTELTNKDLVSVYEDTDTDTHSFEYIVGTEYKKGNLVVKDKKLYLVNNNITATNFDTELSNEDIIAVDTNTDIDTHAYEYEVGKNYKKSQLIIKDNKLYIVSADFTSVDFDTELTNNTLIPVDTNTNIDTNTVEYEQNKTYKKDTLVYLGSKLVRVVTDFTSDNTETTIEDSYQKDIDDNKLILITSESTGSGSELTEDVTSNVVVGNIKSGDKLTTGTTFTEFVKKLLVKEVLPVGNLTAYKSGLNLKGSTVTTPQIKIDITLGSGAVQKVEFYRDGTLEQTENYVSGINSYQYNTTDVTIDTTIQAKLYYTQKDGTTTGVLTYTKSYKFMNNSYFGVCDNIPTAADILTLTTNLKDIKGFTGTANPVYQHVVYAYPASLGNLTTIKDQNNFEYINSYTKTTLTVNSESYNVYYLTDKVTATGFKQIYS